MNPYIGHSMQLSGVQEYRLTGGKGDGMRMLRVRNGQGLDFEISLDRCADITMLSLNGKNMSYISPCGYVHPSYFRGIGDDFLKSFTAGFCTTCGFTAVGSPCTDDGEELPLHGTASNIPCEKFSVEENDDEIIIKAQIRDAAPFSHHLLLMRTYKVSKIKNTIDLNDCIVNIASSKSPIQLLYHCNMGYPLLSENAIVNIPSTNVKPRNAQSAPYTDTSLIMEKPQNGFVERCYYYDTVDYNGVSKCGIYNPDIDMGMVMKFKNDTLDYFTQWKMMGEVEYVLGLEPGNCTPDGRDVMRKEGKLKFIEPGEEYKTHITFTFASSEKAYKEEI